MKRRSEIPAALALLALLAAPVAAADWPAFRGDAQLSGVAAAGLPDGLQPLWVFEIPDGIESTAAIVAGTVYVGGLDGVLYAIDLETGKSRWRYEAGAEILAAPAVSAGKVLVGDGDGVFHAVDAASGERRWIYETRAKIVSSASVADGKLVFGSHDMYLHALNVEDGRPLWKVETDNYVYGAPAISRGRVLSAGCDGYLRVIGLADGKEQARMELGGYVGASPAVRGSRLYVGTFENQVLGIDLESRRLSWTYENSERKFPFLSSAAAGDSVVVLGGRDKLVHALDPETGKPRWTRALKGKIDASPVIAGRRVYVPATSGEIVALDLESGEVVWSFDTGSSITASPSVAAGRLVIGTAGGQLYCFGKR